MTKYKANLEDAFDRASLATDLSNLATAFDEWENQDGQGTRQLWSVLGKVYELGARIDQNGSVKLDLIDEVRSDPNVAKSSKWNPSSKGARELLLVKLLGLKEETKAKKSQWLSAIRAAEIAQTRPIQSDFVAFLDRAGGVDGARRLHAKPRSAKLTYDELVQEALDLVDSDADPAHKITTPGFFGATPELPGGFGLVVVYGERVGDKATRVATIADQKLIARCIEFLLKGKKAYDADCERDIAKERKAAVAEMKRAKKKLRAQYPKDKKASLEPHRYPTFPEYVDEKFEEGEHLSRLKAQNLDEYEIFLRDIPEL